MDTDFQKTAITVSNFYSTVMLKEQEVIQSNVQSWDIVRRHTSDLWTVHMSSSLSLTKSTIILYILYTHDHSKCFIREIIISPNCIIIDK